MCAFDAWVKAAEAIPALTERSVLPQSALNILNDIFGVREIRSHMEIIVGSTVIASELHLKTFEEIMIELELGDHASATLIFSA
jgi:hypothetical protein